VTKHTALTEDHTGSQFVCTHPEGKMLVRVGSRSPIQGKSEQMKGPPGDAEADLPAILVLYVRTFHPLYP
jgi:hypothetical protein